jgi:hypothetical protein
MPGKGNVVIPSLVLPENIYLPPLHIKLGLTENFVKGMDKTSRGFEYVKMRFQILVTQKSRRVYL